MSTVRYSYDSESDCGYIGIGDGDGDVTRTELLNASLHVDRDGHDNIGGGIGRTGTVVGCWLIRHGLTGDGALEQLAEWWKHVEKSWLHPRSPQTRQQRDYVRGWGEQPTRRRA